MDKVERFIKGELNRTPSIGQQQHSVTSSTGSAPRKTNSQRWNSAVRQASTASNASHVKFPASGRQQLDAPSAVNCKFELALFIINFITCSGRRLDREAAAETVPFLCINSLLQSVIFFSFSLCTFSLTGMSYLCNFTLSNSCLLCVSFGSSLSCVHVHPSGSAFPLGVLSLDRFTRWSLLPSFTYTINYCALNRNPVKIENK